MSQDYDNTLWCSTGMCAGAPAIAVATLTTEDGHEFEIPVCDDCKERLSEDPNAIFAHAQELDAYDYDADNQRVIDALGSLKDSVDRLANSFDDFKRHWLKTTRNQNNTLRK